MDVSRVVMGRLIYRERWASKHRDHPLKGEWTGHRECHLEPDWLLICRVEDDTITFEQTGNHSDLLTSTSTGPDLAELIADVVGFEGRIEKDLSKPDGTPGKLLDVSRLNELGWKAPTSLREGIRETYEWYLRHEAAVGE